MTNERSQKYYENLGSLWKSKAITVAQEKELFLWLDEQKELVIEIPITFAQNEQLLKEEIFNTIQQRIHYRPKWSRTRFYRTAAAAVFVILLGSLYILDQDFSKENSVKDISPGRVGATLTLSNGRKIALSGNTQTELKGEEGMRITKTGAGQISYHVLPGPAQARLNTLSTSNGQQYQLILPDQTKVLLNAASSITYPINFENSEQRKVEITGEAYFEVSKDALHPFVVKAMNQEIVVLGTHFDINAYADEPYIKTSLMEGQIRVRSLQTQKKPKSVVLTPGQESLLSKDDLIVRNSEIESVLAWTKGDFIFNDEPLESVMRKIAKWYDVEIIYDATITKEISIGGFLSRSRPISSVLERIQKTANVKFRLEGRKVYVSI